MPRSIRVRPFPTLSASSPIAPGAAASEHHVPSKARAIRTTTRFGSRPTSDFRDGLQFNASYTFSKSIDYNSQSSQGVTRPGQLQPARRPRLVRLRCASPVCDQRALRTAVQRQPTEGRLATFVHHAVAERQSSHAAGRKRGRDRRADTSRERQLADRPCHPASRHLRTDHHFADSGNGRNRRAVVPKSGL